MKRVITLFVHLLVLLSLYSSMCLSQKIDWKCIYREAKLDAYLQGKFLLLYFTGMWDPSRSEVDDPRLKMEMQVWKDTSIVRLTRQYVCVRLPCTIEGTPMPSYDPKNFKDRVVLNQDKFTLHHRITAVPTTVITDPIDNEFARIVGYTTSDEVRKILRIQVPPLFPVYQVLQELEKKPDDVGLEIAAADAYRKIGIPHLSNQYYDKVLDADTLETDAALREQVNFGRAVNFARMSNMREGIDLFEKQLDRYPASSNRPHYLLWLVKLSLQTLEETKARTYLGILEKEFPESEQTKSARALFVK